MKQELMALSGFLKGKRKKSNLTHQQLAEKAGIGLSFIRELEQALVENNVENSS